MITSLGPLARRLFALADSPDDTPEDRVRHRFLIATGLAMSCGGLLWGTLGLLVGTPLPAIIPYSYPVATAINFAFLHRTKRFVAARTFQISISLALPFLFQWSLGGFHPSGAMMLWAMLSLVASLSFEEPRDSVRWWILFLALTVLSGFIDGRLEVPATVDEASLGRLFITLNLCTVVSAVL